MNIFSLLTSGYTERGGLYVPESHVSQTVWDTLAKSDLLDAATSATSEAHAIKKGEAQIDKLTHEANGGVLLDVGCGYGRVAEQLLPKRSFDAYLGVDGSIEMLQYAHARKKERGNITTPMYFIYGKIDALPLQDASVDTVVVSAVFLHNHKRVTRVALSEIYRVLKPGGKLFVFGSFPSMGSLMGIQGALYNAALHLFGDPYRNGPVRFFTAHEVRALLSPFAHATIVPSGFAVLPKRVLIFPNVVNAAYLRFIAHPINMVLRGVLPTWVNRRCATHHDVVASK